MPDRPKTFPEVVAAAIEDIIENGFDSMERIQRWTREIRLAAEHSLVSPASMEQQLRDALAAVYRKMIDQGGVLRFNPGVERFTLEKVKPALRNELDRRIMASANLIKLNRTEAVEKTLRRFQGWSTSIPAGGVTAEKKRDVRANVRKALTQLPFEERRVLIDQGAKLIAAINDIVATDGGAIAGFWVSHYKQQGYNFRPDHAERDSRENNDQPFLVRDSWAHKAGLVKKGKLGYVDDVTAPATEPFCRCLPGSARIPFADVEVVSRRWYDGPSVTIKTVTGREITATPNHPVLSSLGWKAANLVNPGDYLIEIAQKERQGSFANRNQNDAVPTIAQIFGSLVESGAAQVRAGRVEDFHGDGRANSDVDIIATTGSLLVDCISPAYQSVSKFLFADPDFPRSAARAFCDRNLRLPLAGFIENLSLAVADFLAIVLSPQFLRLGYATNRDASSNQTAADSRWMHAEVFGDNLEARSGYIRLDNFGDIEFKASRVVEVDRGVFNGHVYNLQTSSGAYVANGIVTHNCYYRYAYNLRDLPTEMLTAKGRAALANVQGQEEVRSARQARADSAGDVIEEATARDRLGYLRGIKTIKTIPDRDDWHAKYDPDEDEIELENKFHVGSRAKQLHVLLHEAGHRGQEVDPDFYEAFKRLGLNRESAFLEMANPIHLKDFERRGDVDGGYAAEVFAESYARWTLGLAMPGELERFWSERKPVSASRSTPREAEYIATWPNKVTRCQRCTMFIRLHAATTENACTAVAGPISAHGHCKHFEIGQPDTFAKAGANYTNPIPVPVDRDHDVRWMFVVSKNCDRLYADQTLPRAVTIKGKTFDPADLGWAHEHGEFTYMLKLIAAFIDRHRRAPNEAEKVVIYDFAHEHGGVPAEKARAKEMGVDWSAWEAWSRGELARLENRRISNPPPDSHVDPTGHRHHELMEAVA